MAADVSPFINAIGSTIQWVEALTLALLIYHLIAMFGGGGKVKEAVGRTKLGAVGDKISDAVMRKEEKEEDKLERVSKFMEQLEGAEGRLDRKLGRDIVAIREYLQQVTQEIEQLIEIEEKARGQLSPQERRIFQSRYNSLLKDILLRVSKILSALKDQRSGIRTEISQLQKYVQDVQKDLPGIITELEKTTAKETTALKQGKHLTAQAASELQQAKRDLPQLKSLLKEAQDASTQKMNLLQQQEVMLDQEEKALDAAHQTVLAISQLQDSAQREAKLRELDQKLRQLLNTNTIQERTNEAENVKLRQRLEGIAQNLGTLTKLLDSLRQARAKQAGGTP